MANYTDFLEDTAFELFDTDDYTEELKKAMTYFRTFDQALDTFLVAHGFSGDIHQAEEKVRFLREKCKAAGVPVPRNLKKWYEKHVSIDRKTAFLIGFAFDLTVAETNDFLRRICLERGIDCHIMEEAVYYFARKQKMGYEETQVLLEKIRLVKPGKLSEEQIVYTREIVREIEEIQSPEELVIYLNENTNKFAYNNAAAYRSIRFLWEKISGKNGIAMRERKLLYMPFDLEQDAVVAEGQRKERVRMADSIWEIYLQILGLSGKCASKIYEERSLKVILKNQELLHPFVEASFPDRDGLNKILLGNHVSYERVRKMMILLVFYKFWTEKALKKHSYSADYGDADRWIATVNDYLTEAGYPVLYPGNPYDFLFLMASNSENPLMSYRDYMRELFSSKMVTEVKEPELEE